MSQENVEAVQQLIDAWNRGDVDGWLQSVHPDGEWSSAILRQVEGSDAATYRGHEELRRFWDEWHELWALTVEPSEIQDLGETVVVLARMSTRGNESGVDLDREIGYVCELEDGLIRRTCAYFSAEATLEAAGLSEQTMSYRNIEQARRAADAYSRRDVEALLKELDPEIEWHAALPMLLGGDAAVYRGHEGVRELFREINDAFAEIHVEYSEIRDLGDRVVAIGRIRTRGKASGAATESPIATVSEIRNGKGFRIQSYLDLEEALKAAGLRG